MNIGQVAKLTGLSSKSIRLYEDKNMIPAPSRTDAGYRQYGEKHIQALRVIARAKNAGFSLAECKELVDLWQNSEFQSREVKQKAIAKQAEVRQRIVELQQIEKHLSDWIAACPGDSSSHCPIMDELTKEE